MLDYPQRMEIVIEKIAIAPHPLVQLPFARVTKRRMPDVMHQGQRLGQIGIEGKRAGRRAGDLSHLECGA